MQEPAVRNGPARSFVLVYDAGFERCAHLNAVIVKAGYQVREETPPASLTDLASRLNPRVILMTAAASKAHESLAAVARLRVAGRQLPVVFVVEAGSEALAVAAFRAGVDDYFSEPIDYDALVASITRSITAGHRLQAARAGPGSVALPGLVGSSEPMQRIESYLGKVADRDITVLITGETGTGKELAATLIHKRSARRQGRFVPVNCAAIPEGLLESELFGHESGAFTGAVGPRPGLLQVADRGTVFLDEVGDMGLVGQAKVLRAIESRELYRVGGKRAVPFDVRVIAATNQDLERAVDEGRFRKDFFFRLNVARIHLPPLRERRSDIVSLLEHYLAELNGRGEPTVEGFSDDALSALQAYDWPGNVREVKNLIEEIFVCPPARLIGIDDLPEAFRRRLGGVSSLSAAERKRLIEALFATNWNKSRAAGLLQWSRMTLYRKMAKHSVLRSTEAHLSRRAK